MRTPTFSVEVITVPVSDVERALRFYVDQVGFTLDVDYSPNDAFRIVQQTAECPHNERVVSRQVPPLEFSLYDAGNCSRS